MRPQDLKSARLLENRHDVADFFDWLLVTLESGRTISIDTETGSIDKLWTPLPLTGQGFCRLWQVGTATEGWAIPAQQWHGVVHEAMDLVRQANNIVAFANCKFDAHVMTKEGWGIVPWHRVNDVVLMHRLVHPEQQQHGLKPSCVDAFGDWAGAGQWQLKQDMAEHGWDWETIPVDWPSFWQYGVMDVCLTVGLHDHLLPLTPSWFDVESEYQRIMFGAECRGLLVDFDRLDYAEELWQAEVDDLAAELKLLGFARPSSNKAVIAAFEQLGFDPQEFSEKTGDPTYNKMVLESMALMGEPTASAARALIAYRRASKWNAVYGRGLRAHTMPDGKVPFTVNTMLARTGRSSISRPGPALQTIPSSAVPRNCFRAKDGRNLWAIDYSSQESRITAALSEDPAFMGFFATGEGDIHTYVAEMAGITRPLAKTLNYALAFGSGTATMAQSSGVTTEVMDDVVFRFNQAFPRYEQWRREVVAEAEKRTQEDGYPWVELPYGRRAALEEGREYTQAANTLTQGHGADVLKLATIRLDQAGYGEAIVLPVHDELLVSLPSDDHTSAHDMAKIMEDNRLPVPLTTDVSGPLKLWGEKYE